MTYFTASIIYSVYNFTMPLIRPGQFETTPVNCIRILAWLFIEIFPISLLTTNGTNATTEMKKTLDTIDEILDRCILCRGIKSELNHCSLELLHNNFEFTAFDVIAINNTILRSIFSAVVTYLIIFIQFQLSGIRKNVRTNESDSLDS
uniref:Gustatory receptor n=1 Tax=Meteorus pulchricornis TaxID=51522 RepID=A0A346TLL9_9HYME|nr:gustatory receptor [Meteorus pulchricornis]